MGVGLQVSLANLGVGQILNIKIWGPAVDNLTPKLMHSVAVSLINSEREDSYQPIAYNP